MKITFLGGYKSFDYRQIGGIDSLARRLGGELVRMGHEVSFVHFGGPSEQSEITPEGVRLRYFIGFEEALEYLAENVQHVITIYIPPRNRLAWISFRKSQDDRIKFHMYYSGWPESWIRRNMGYLDARLRLYNGTLFCASPRLENEVSRWADRTALLLPPVSRGYFLDPDSKTENGSLRVTFMGRIDPKKGTDNVIDFFKYLAEKAPDIKTVISGYHWKQDPESVQLHRELLHQGSISYMPVEFDGHSPEVEEAARMLLRETDILFLPYARLSSTVDTPLLLLEGMAHLCVVVTRPLGSMPDVYGTSEYMLDNLTDYELSLRLFKHIERRLPSERVRLASRCQKRDFEAGVAAKKLLSSIGEK